MTLVYHTYQTFPSIRISPPPPDPPPCPQARSWCLPSRGLDGYRSCAGWSGPWRSWGGPPVYDRPHPTPRSRGRVGAARLSGGRTTLARSSLAGRCATWRQLSYDAVDTVLSSPSAPWHTWMLSPPVIKLTSNSAELKWILIYSGYYQF